MQTTADRVKLVRKFLKVTQAQLGKLAGGLTKQAVCQWESGDTKPDRGALHALQKSRGISGDWVLEGTGQMLDASASAAGDSAPHATLSPRQQALLGFFDGLTEAQQDDVIRELQAKKQLNDELLTQLLARPQAS